MILLSTWLINYFFHHSQFITETLNSELPWPPIKIYVYPENPHQTLECLHPPENPNQYEDQTGFFFQRMLEPVIHHQFILSPIYTTKPDMANIFFIPHYSRMCSGIDNSRWNQLEQYLQTYGNYFHRYSSVDHFIIHSAPNYMDKPADWAIYKDKSPSIGILDFKNSQLSKHVWQASRSIVLPFITIFNDKIPPVNKPRPLTAFVAMSTKGLKGKSARLRQKLEMILSRIPKTKITIINRKNLSSFRLIINNLSQSMTNSDYCIVPPGDAPSSKRFYDAISSLCIPILASDYFMLPFENIPIDYTNIILQVAERLIDNIPKIISKQSFQDTIIRRHKLEKLRKMFTWRFEEPPRKGEALWMLSWALYDRYRMMEPYFNSDLTGNDSDPFFDFSFSKA